MRRVEMGEADPASLDNSCTGSRRALVTLATPKSILLS